MAKVLVTGGAGFIGSNLAEHHLSKGSRVYISNSARARRDFGWMPKVSKEEGINKLCHWMRGEE